MTPRDAGATVEGRHGFAFLDGPWHVRNRRLVDFLDPASGWEEFDGHTSGRLHWGGGAHVDEITFPSRGYSGITDRAARWEQAFAPEGSGEWVTNWVMDFSRA
ncbi:hypothetical protein [Streptomyces sp. NPDC003327]